MLLDSDSFDSAAKNSHGTLKKQDQMFITSINKIVNIKKQVKLCEKEYVFKFK